MSKAISINQKQTQEAFSYKWDKRDSYESAEVQTEWKRWLIEKYFGGDSHGLQRLLGNGRKRILDAGCGAGGSALLLFGEHLKKHSYTGIDISDAVEIAKKRFKENEIPGEFIECDLSEIPEKLGQFDIIFSEGVLHHTDNTECALQLLTRRLTKGGYFLFYVYAKKAPIREYTDDFIREKISTLSDGEAWEALMPLTKLGKTLGDMNIEIEIPEDIPYLGITKGKHDLQRFFFYKICKAYYRKEYSLEEMNQGNFDWFRPLNCQRHTPEEVESFCMNSGLYIERINVEESGISVIATKI